MWIIKLEGSLIGSPELLGWLDVVERNGDGKVVIAPGGGYLADAVRAVQKMTNVSDKAAHDMAVLAMDQYGLLMAGLNPKLTTARSELELSERGWQHRGIIWLPSRMVHADNEIPKDHSMTSDSLAAWVGSKHDAAHVVLVKSLQTTNKEASVDDLIARGWVDAHLREFMHAKNYTNGFKTWIINKKYYTLFSQKFDENLLAEHALQVLP